VLGAVCGHVTDRAARDSQARRAARRSPYTRAIVKPANLAEKSDEQQTFYRQMTLAEVLDTELEYVEYLRWKRSACCLSTFSHTHTRIAMLFKTF
jgi:hypothetical protein